MATFPTNQNLNPPSPTARTYTELRIHTVLLCRIVTLLSQLVGPTIQNAMPAGSVLNNTPYGGEDPTRDADIMRNDPEFQTR